VPRRWFPYVTALSASLVSGMARGDDGAPSAASEPAPAASSAAAPATVTVEGAPRPRSASEIRVDARVLASTPHRTGSEALRTVPGVSVSQHSGEGKPHQLFVRGFDAGHGQDVEVWVAGVPVNDVSHLHGQGYADLHFVFPEAIRSISASLGPYDVRQGDFGVAGTVRFDLGLAEPGFHAKGTLGLFGTHRLVLAYRPPSEPESTFVAFEGYGTAGFGPSRSAERGSLLTQATFGLSPRLALRVVGTGYGTRFESAGVVLRDDLERGAIDRFESYAPGQGGKSTRFALGLELRGRSSMPTSESSGSEAPRAEFSVAPYVVHRTTELRTNFTGRRLDPLRGDLQEQRDESLSSGLVAWYRRKVDWLGARDELEAGLAARGTVSEQRQRRGGTAVIANDAPLLVDASLRSLSLSAFCDFATRPLRWLEARAGVRIDTLLAETSDRSLDALSTRGSAGAYPSARGTVTFFPGGGVQLVASAGNGFRSPQFRQLANGERAPFTEVVSVEAGARYERLGVSAQLAAFHSRLSADVVFTPEVARAEPIPSTARTGASAAIEVRHATWLVARASGTFTLAQLTADGLVAGVTSRAGDLVPYAPLVVARAELGADPEVTSLRGYPITVRGGFGASYLARRPLPYGEWGRDSLVLDARLGARYRWVEAGIDAQNLLDSTYFDGEFVYSSDFGRGGSTLVPRRHVTVGPPLTLLFHLSLHLG
jgi:iron complex outermembrane receptor protein